MLLMQAPSVELHKKVSSQLSPDPLHVVSD